MAAVKLALSWLIQSLSIFVPFLILGFLASSMALLIGAFLARYLLQDWLLPIETAILLKFKAHANASFDRAMTAITYLAQCEITIPLSILISSILLSREQPSAALMLMINLSGSWLLNGLFKSFFRRKRPQLWTTINSPVDYSYPSGHTMSASSFYGLLAVYLAYLFRITLGWTTAAAVATAFLVGFSRLYLGVHWTTDVISGWIAGTIWFVACLQGLMQMGGI